VTWSKEASGSTNDINFLFSWATVSISIRTVLARRYLDVSWFRLISFCRILLIVKVIFCCWYNLWRLMCMLNIDIIQFPLAVYAAVYASFPVCPICFVLLWDVDVEEDIWVQFFHIVCSSYQSCLLSYCRMGVVKMCSASAQFLWVLWMYLSHNFLFSN
jgi:hypothetical protein